MVSTYVYIVFSKATTTVLIIRAETEDDAKTTMAVFYVNVKLDFLEISVKGVSQHRNIFTFATVFSYKTL
jgi:hypothetical protein